LTVDAMASPIIIRYGEFTMWGPAVKLMNRIGFGAKFLVIGGFGAAALCLMLTQYVLNTNASIASTSSELAGVRYVAALDRLVDALQRHRGLSTTLLRGDASVEPKVAAAAADATEALGAVEAQEASSGAEFETAGSFATLKQQVGATLAGMRAAKPAENFARHTTTIKTALAHMRLVADGSQLTLDPVAETYYLMDAAVFRMPVYAESAAKLRGSVSALIARKEVSPEDAGAARQLLGEMDMTLEMVREGLGKVMKRVPSVRAALETADADLLARHNAVKALVSGEVLAGKYDKLPAAFFEFATGPVAASQKLGSDAQASLSVLLAAREARLKGERNTSVAMSVLVLLIMLYLAGGAYVAMRKSVQALVAGGKRLAEGDLTVQVAVESRDEFATIAGSFNSIGNALGQLLGDVSRSARTMSSSAHTLSAMSAQALSATVAQNDSAAAMAASIEELTVSITHVADSSQEALKASREAGDLSKAGNQAVQGAAGEMDGIAGAAQEFAAVVASLGEESAQISRIVGVIEGIAGQTNLLALNAAIEAARAGEQGRGFAVVADEVRKLAERTAQSTREIVGMVAGIQEGTARAVGHVESWKASIGEGVAKARGAGEQMTRIESGAAQVVTAVNEISTALAEQSAASSDIARNVEQIARMSEENRHAVGSVANEAGQLEQLAAGLNDVVGRFKLRPATA
jgi:methyl-accepting chemotaxis protein